MPLRRVRTTGSMGYGPPGRLKIFASICIAFASAINSKSFVNQQLNGYDLKMLNFLVAKKTLLERDLPPPKWFGVYTLRDGNGFTSIALLATVSRHVKTRCRALGPDGSVEHL